jgi:HAD superfamily hydrolase (TIGR01549 family)
VLEAITLDLWGTILYPKDAPEKVERRRAMILAALAESGLEIDVPTLRAGYRAAAQVNRQNLARELKDVGPPGRWLMLTEQLGLPPDRVPYARIAAAYEDLTLEYIPPLMPGAAEAVERLRSRYRLGLICNTGFTGGKVLREVLKRHRLHDHFEILVFSNEYGWLKPDPRIFHHALEALAARPERAAHVGDDEQMDVAGAINAGVTAVHYLPDGVAPSRADLIFHHWDEFEAALDQHTNRGNGRTSQAPGAVR